MSSLLKVLLYKAENELSAAEFVETDFSDFNEMVAKKVSATTGLWGALSMRWVSRTSTSTTSWRGSPEKIRKNIYPKHESNQLRRVIGHKACSFSFVFASFSVYLRLRYKILKEEVIIHDYVLHSLRFLEIDSIFHFFKRTYHGR